MSNLPQTVATMLATGRLVHALCLEGGSEQTGQLAQQLAGAILCERQQGEMCGECLHCRKVLAGVHTDLVQPDPAVGYKKDAMRLLRAEVYRSPHEGRAKVLLLRDAHLMSAEVQNLLLKVMEEPPADSYFVLTTDNRYRLLSTVLSRMVSVTLPEPPDTEVLEELLQSDAGKTAQTLLQAAAAGGGYRLLTALQSAEKNRQDYTAALRAADRLLCIEVFCNQLGLSLARRLRLRQAVALATARNESNGYLPIISAAFAEQAARR